MHIFNIYDAKAHLSKLIDRVAKGEEIIISKAGKPIIKLVPITPAKPKRYFGVLQGKIEIADDFDAPLPNIVFTHFKDEQ